jgi:hypothetical protein
VELPPVQELLARVPRQLALLLLLGEVSPQAAQVAAVLVQEAALELLVLRAVTRNLWQAAHVDGFLLIFRGTTPLEAVVICFVILAIQEKRMADKLGSANDSSAFICFSQFSSSLTSIIF